MKLLIVTSLEEHQSDVADILEKAGVDIFSVTKTTGFMNRPNEELADNWFARAKDHVDSVVLFSFTNNENATRALADIIKYNDDGNGQFPVRAFVVPVEKASYSVA